MVERYNEAWKKAFETGIYECPMCGAPMQFEDDMEDVLICPECNYDMPTEKYGYTDEEWEELQAEEEDYPSLFPENQTDEDEADDEFYNDNEEDD